MNLQAGLRSKPLFEGFQFSASDQVANKDGN
jgi:hypothetical protein